MLTINRLETGYGKNQVIYDLSLEVKEQEIIALIGPNGAGKSSALKAICGLIPVWKGDILFNNSLINNSTPAQNVSRGIVFAPQGYRVFDELTVIENLEIGGLQLSAYLLKEQIEEMFKLFPILKGQSRKEAGKLSGGEQQMLAFARALMSKPKLLLLDEPSSGLSPTLVATTFEKIKQINSELGVSILVVEQNVPEVLRICNRVYSMKLGRVAFTGQPLELKENNQRLKELFL